MQPFRLIEENLRAAMACYAQATPQGEERGYEGLALTSCGLNSSVFNSAMLTTSTSVESLPKLLEIAAVHFDARDFGWSFWLCEDLLTGAKDRAAPALRSQRNLGLIASPPGMYAEALLPPLRPAADLEFRRVSCIQTRLDFAHLSSMIFLLPFAVAKQIYGEPPLWSGSLTGWVGYERGRAVCIVSVVIAAGAAGVYSLGTLPEYQGRGFGETALRHALQVAFNETGVARTVLQSTSRGLNLYLRLGYRTATSFGVYLKDGCR